MRTCGVGPFFSYRRPMRAWARTTAAHTHTTSCPPSHGVGPRNVLPALPRRGPVVVQAAQPLRSRSVLAPFLVRSVTACLPCGVRVVLARPPCLLGSPVVRMPVGRRVCWAATASEWRLRSAPPPASLRSAQPKGYGETVLPRRHVRPRTCADIDAEAQKKAAENQRLKNRLCTAFNRASVSVSR